MQTERVTFLMSPARKAAIAAQAADRGISLGEFVRRKVEDLEDELSPQQEAELAVLVAHVNEAIPKMEAAFDEMSRTMQETHEEVDRMLRAMGARR